MRIHADPYTEHSLQKVLTKFPYRIFAKNCWRHQICYGNKITWNLDAKFAHQILFANSIITGNLGTSSPFVRLKNRAVNIWFFKYRWLVPYCKCNQPKTKLSDPFTEGPLKVASVPLPYLWSSCSRARGQRRPWQPDRGPHPGSPQLQTPPQQGAPAGQTPPVPNPEN